MEIGLLALVTYFEHSSKRGLCAFVMLSERTPRKEAEEKLYQELFQYM